MLTADELAAWGEVAASNEELTALLGAVRRRTTPLLDALPPLPRGKAMLSRDGGVCPEDGTPLRYDPWAPDAHACPRCGKSFSGERHHGHWARSQHLWLAERMGDLALLAAVEGDPQCAVRLDELMAHYEQRYFDCPNRDNVLGPSHLFFSTYLESLWVTNWLAAAFMAREAGLLSEERIDGVNQIAEEAAALIGEFNEGLSNRQTWHAAALTAIAVWFGDEELARTMIEARTGLLGHLADGFGEDGLWFEGENYHMFALRGLVVGVRWARMLGFDLLETPEVREHFAAALLAPARTALPDLTFPARKDARYGMSLAHPAFLEVFEVGRAWLDPDDEIDRWVGALYAAPVVPSTHYDAWLHDAGLPESPRRRRSDLSPLVLLAFDREPAPAAAVWEPPSHFLANQGLVVLRNGDRYVSLECAGGGGGHGHPDQLHLTVHAAGVHWLPDPGAGSYVDRTLFWYRSPLAHNAPVIGGTAPSGDIAGCAAFDSRGPWGWGRGRAGDVTRTIVAGPDHLVDMVELAASGPCRLELPWHLAGDVSLSQAGRWEPAELDHEAVSAVERFLPEPPGSITLDARGPGDVVARLHLDPQAELLRARAPGLPGEAGDRTFYVQRISGMTERLLTIVDLSAGDRAVQEVRLTESGIEVIAPSGTTSYRFTPAGVTVRTAGETVELGGLRPVPARPKPPLEERLNWDAQAEAPHAWTAPPCDGTLDGFDMTAPLDLAGEHQYRRSEEPYDEGFVAQAWVNWDREAVYVAVAVTKPNVLTREDGAPPLDLDNEPDDIHIDGLQVYLRLPGEAGEGRVVTLRGDGSLRCRAIGEPDGTSARDTSGTWSRTEEGYLATLRWAHPRIGALHQGVRVGFDLIVNEARPGRVRRAGQLVWTGGEGWVYLLGDRQPAEQFGALILG